MRLYIKFISLLNKEISWVFSIFKVMSVSGIQAFLLKNDTISAPFSSQLTVLPLLQLQRHPKYNMNFCEVTWKVRALIVT